MLDLSLVTYTKARDFSGNELSSTVVAAAMCLALIACQQQAEP